MSSTHQNKKVTKQNNDVLSEQDDPFLGLSNYKDIDAKFNTFSVKHCFIAPRRSSFISGNCTADKQKLSSNFKSQKSYSPHLKNSLTSSQTQFKNQEQQQLTTTNQDIKSVQGLSKRVSSNFTKQFTKINLSPKIHNNNTLKDPKQGLSPSVHKPNNISTAKDFIWLISKLSKSSEKYDFLHNESLCKELGVNYNKLVEITNQDQRQYFIIQSLKAQCSNDIQQFENSQSIGVNIIETQEKELYKDFQRKSNETKHEVLKWLKLKSNYSELRNKAKICLVENIHDFNNAEMIRQQINSKSIKNSYYHSQRKINLNVRQLNDVKTNDPEGQSAVEEKASQYQWDSNTEKKFQENKEIAKAKLSKQIPSTNWYDLSINPIMREMIDEKGFHSRREILLEKHKNREILTEEEMQFLAGTSELLNRNIDKSYVQKVIDQLDNNIIDKIELHLAEEIISKYKRVITIAKQKRSEYLKNKTNKQMKNLKKSKVFNLHEALMTNRIVEQLLNGKKSSEIKLHVAKPNRLGYQFAKNIEKKVEADEKLQLVFASKQGNNLGCQEELLKKQRKVIYTSKDGNDITIGQSQRLFHPNSKLVLNLDFIEQVSSHAQSEITASCYQKQDIANIIQQKKEMMDRRAKIRNLEFGADQSIFQKFYSSGPKSQQNGNTLHQNAWITDEVRNQAAMIVQKSYRMFKSRMKYLNILEERLQENLKRGHAPPILGKNSVTIGINQLLQNIQKLNLLNNSKTPSSPNATPKQKIYSNSSSLTPRDHRVLLNYNFNHRTHKSDHIIEQKQLSLPITDENEETDRSTRNCSFQQNYLTKDISKATPETNATLNVQQYSPPQQFTDFILKFSPRQDNYSEQTKKQSLHRGQSIASQKGTSNGNSQAILQKCKSMKTQQLDSRNRNQQKDANNIFNLNKIDLISEGNQKITKSNSVHDRLSKQNTPRNNNNNNNIPSLRSDEARQKHLEIMREKMYQNSLFVKQIKLLSAAVHNNLNFIKNSGYVLNKNDVNVKDKKGNAALIYAIRHKNIQFVQYLLQIGSDVNIKCSLGNTPLHAAFEINDEVMIMDFMDNGGNLNILNDDQQTPLAMGSFSLIKKMGLEKGIARFSSNGEAFHPQNSLEEQNDSQSMRYAMSIDNNSIFWKIYKKKQPQKLSLHFERNNDNNNEQETESAEQIVQEISRVNEQQSILYQIPTEFHQ